MAIWRMAAILLLAAALTGCKTPYQANGVGGGYEDQPIGGDRFQIRVRGNAVTTRGDVEQIFLQRAQAIAAEHQYADYRILQLTIGYDPLPIGHRPVAFGIIEGQGKADAGGGASGKGDARGGGGGSGTGLVIGADGTVLTNFHVAGKCREITVRRGNAAPVAARLVAGDATNDLAVIRAPLPGAAAAAFRDGSDVRQGDGVIVVGFPWGDHLSTATKLTTGTVSALVGLHDDARKMQISAPVQPGNSGGPVFDESGRVVGVVVSSLGTLTNAAVAGGALPQNMNFAIKSGVVRTFLDANAIAYERATSAKPLSAAEIGARAEGLAVYINCDT
jgi:S1-C subfamily serine protease